MTAASGYNTKGAEDADDHHTMKTTMTKTEIGRFSTIAWRGVHAMDPTSTMMAGGTGHIPRPT
jgi:hypothetical protein